MIYTDEQLTAKIKDMIIKFEVEEFEDRLVFINEGNSNDVSDSERKMLPIANIRFGKSKQGKGYTFWKNIR